MPTITNTYSVDSSSQAWTPGPTGILNTQKLIIRASGYAMWSPAPFYSQVEGAYPGFAMVHTLDPYTLSKPNPAGTVTNVPGLSMAILAVPSGVVPNPLIPGNPGRGDALVPRWTLDEDGVTRVALFTPSDMSNKSLTYGPWDIFFGYVDGDYTGNVGVFSVTTYVTDVDEQPAGLISLPGHLTQDDIDTAAFCSFSGLLTPGNRQRMSSEDRMLADLFAPYKQAGPKEL